MSYAVSQSTRELGLRMALGASGSDLLRLVMSRGLALAVGVALGVVGAAALSRVIADLLYHVSPRDPDRSSPRAEGLIVRPLRKLRA